MKHYILCQHGLLGSQADFRNFAEYFHSIPGNPVEVIILTASAGVTQTLDGVSKGGRRCMNEIRGLFESGVIPKHSTVSLLGHSLGGLYIRYALRQIEIDNPTLWESFCVKRNFCIFLATPHLGIECSGWVIRNSVNFIFRHLSSTADDLSLRSTILEDISDSAGVQSLIKFERIVLYGNRRGDNLVSLSSSLLVLPGSLTETHTDPGTTVTEFFPSSVADVSNPTENRAVIERNINSGVRNLSRFIVNFSPGLPETLAVVDNSAHYRIICHEIIDRGKAGLPVLKHIEGLLIK